MTVQPSHFKSTPNQLFQFDNQEYQIRFFTDTNNDIWAVAQDIASTLGMSNLHKQISKLPDHWSYQYKSQGLVNFTLIKEPAIYRLVMRSNKPNAISFQMWVCEDVLPSIRKTGGYSIPQQTKSIQLLNSQRDTCTMLMKFFPNDDLVKERVKDCLISSLADTSGQNAITYQQKKFSDLTSILKDMKYPVHTKNSWDFSALGGYVSKQYQKKYKKKPKKSDKYCNGANRNINVYTNNEISYIKSWITEYFDTKPHFWE